MKVSSLHSFRAVEIKKKASEASGPSPETDDEVERLLHGYVSMCHNAAMEFMKTN